MSDPGDAAKSTVPMPAEALARAVQRDPQLAPGTVLDERYELRRFIARGGMGAVYEAHDRELGVDVALKTIRVDLAWMPSVIERFKREIQLARAVSHPGVCRIFDLGKHGAGDAAVLFLTMELLDGETLAERVRAGGPRPAAEALAWVTQIAEALAAAHAAGIVHRDLKPANVIVATRSGVRRAVVTDFGLARTVERASADAGTDVPDATSHSGTPGYMAPEQAHAGDVAPTVDVYALGVVATELLTGKPDGALDRVTLPAGWAEVIARCTAPRPEDRYVDAAAVVSAIDRLRARPRRRGLVIGAIAAIVLAGAAVTAVIALRPGATAKADDGAPRDPEAARSWRDGMAALRDGNDHDAITALRRVIAREPGFALAHAELGGALRATGRNTEARAETEAASERSGELDREHAMIVEARLRETHDEFPRAVELYEELRRIAPDEHEYLMRLTYAQIASGQLPEAEASLRALAEAGVDHPRVAMHEGYLATMQGDWKRLVDACRRAASAADAIGARRLAALAWDEQGRGHLYLGDHDAAAEALAESARRFEELGDQAGLARVVGHEGHLAAAKGDRDEGRRLFERSLEMYRAIDHRDGTSVTLVALAMYLPPDQLERALALYDEALSLTPEYDDIGRANVQFNAAGIHYKLGDHARARAAFEDVRVVARAHEDRSTLASATINLGVLTLGEADPLRAQILFDEARAAATELGDPTIDAYIAWGLGEIAAARGDVEVARRELGAAIAAADTVLDPSPVEQSRCALAVLDAAKVVATCGAAGDALAAQDLVDEAVLMSWQVIRAHLAARDRAAAAAELAKLHDRAALSLDAHTPVAVKIVDAVVAGDAAALAALDEVSAQAAAIGASTLALEAELARGALLRALGRKREGAAALSALAADATRRGMLTVAARAAAARR